MRCHISTATLFEGVPTHKSKTGCVRPRNSILDPGAARWGELSALGLPDCAAGLEQLWLYSSAYRVYIQLASRTAVEDRAHSPIRYILSAKVPFPIAPPPSCHELRAFIRCRYLSVEAPFPIRGCLHSLSLSVEAPFPIISAFIRYRYL
jgi:hypothetical protein